MTPYEWRRKALVLWIGCLFVVPGFAAMTENRAARIIAIFIAIAGFILLISGYLKYWRCPECGALLPANRFLTASDCPHCGHKL